MTFRIATIAFVLTAAFAGVAQAAPIWNGPGWYHFADTMVGRFLIKGPFASKEACEAILPPDDEEDHYCEYLNERPSWDN